MCTTWHLHSFLSGVLVLIIFVVGQLPFWNNGGMVNSSHWSRQSSLTGQKRSFRDALKLSPQLTSHQMTFISSQLSPLTITVLLSSTPFSFIFIAWKGNVLLFTWTTCLGPDTMANLYLDDGTRKACRKPIYVIGLFPPKNHIKYNENYLY